MVCTLLAGVNVVAFAAEGEVESTPVFCAYNQNNGEHFFTTDEAEYNHLVELTWGAEGEKWQAPVKSSSPIFRLYNQNSGEHYFTLDANEAKSLASIGWNDEGIGLYSDDEKATPVYCMYNPNATGQFEAGAHHYTKDASEAAYLESIGWTWTNDGQAAFYGVKEEEPQILVKLTKAEQKSANTVEVTFDQSAIGLVDKNDIVVAKADGTLVLPANSMELSADGMSAILTLAIPFEDSVDYAVSLNESEAGFTASLGAPAYVTVTTASAQKGVVTPIEFAIYDSKGIDVTASVDVDDTCQVEVTGDDIVADTSMASKSVITMGTVDEVAQVTVTYTDPDDDSKQTIGKGEIKCIPAEAVLGYPIYAEYDSTDDAWINPNNKMAKFYLSEQTTSSDPVSVEVGKESEVVYFSAANLADFSVYSYDEYEVESSDDDIMSVALYDVDGLAPSNEGKQLAFKVTGNQVGTANVVVKATVNDTDAYYSVPVKVTPEGKLSSITYTVDKTTLTNAYDVTYGAHSDVKAVDSNGKELTAGDGLVYDYEVTNGIQKAGESDKGLDSNAVSVIGADATGFDMTDANDSENDYWAFGASAGKRSVKCTVTQGEIDKSKTISINVKALSKGIWAGTTEQSVTYAVEMSKTSIFSDPEELSDDLDPLDLSGNGAKARLAAFVSGNFIGYVTTDNTGKALIGDYDTPASGATGTTINVKAANKIADGTLSVGAKYGSRYTGLTTLVLDPVHGITKDVVELAGETADNFDMSLEELQDTNNIATDFDGDIDVSGFNSNNLDANDEGELPAYAYRLDNQNEMTAFARPGTYSVVFAWISAKDAAAGKDDVQSTTPFKFTVGSAVQDIATHETVAVKTRNVESLTVDGIKEVLSPIADMNNNEGDTSVLDTVGLANAEYDVIEDGDIEGNSFFVKYAVVHESMGAMAVNFYVPINTTFRV